MMYDEDAVFRHVTAVLSTWCSCVQLQQQNSGAATRRTSMIQPGHRKDSECQQMWAVEQAIEMHSKALWHRNAYGTLCHQFELCKMKRWHSGYLWLPEMPLSTNLMCVALQCLLWEICGVSWRPGIKSCRSLALHWGGRALRGAANSFAQRNADRQLDRQLGIQLGLMEDSGWFGDGPKISKMDTFKQHVMVYHGFPKRKISSHFALWNGCVIDYDWLFDP